MRPQSLIFPWLLIFMGAAVALSCGYEVFMSWPTLSNFGDCLLGFAIGSVLAGIGVIEMRATNDFNEGQ